MYFIYFGLFATLFALDVKGAATAATAEPTGGVAVSSGAGGSAAASASCISFEEAKEFCVRASSAVPLDKRARILMDMVAMDADFSKVGVPFLASELTKFPGREDEFKEAYGYLSTFGVEYTWKWGITSYVLNNIPHTEQKDFITCLTGIMGDLHCYDDFGDVLKPLTVAQRAHIKALFTKIFEDPVYKAHKCPAFGAWGSIKCINCITTFPESQWDDFMQELLEKVRIAESKGMWIHYCRNFVEDAEALKTEWLVRAKATK